MFPEVRALLPVVRLLWTRLQAARADDRGMTTEAVIITAALAALAIAATTVIIAKVTGEAESIDVDAPSAP
jgi:hypothetical protein